MFLFYSYQTRGPQGIVIALAGNKCNHESNREVKKEEAERFEEEIGALFFETSAKDGDGVMVRLMDSVTFCYNPYNIVWSALLLLTN